MGDSQNIPAAFALLATEDNPAADAALLQVLPSLGDAARAAAIDLLVSRAHPPTLAALIAGFPRFDEHIKNLLAGQVGALLHARRASWQSSDAATVRGTIELIAHSRSGEFAYLLVETLFGSRPESAKHAAAGLCSLGEHYSECGSCNGHAASAKDATPLGLEAYLESLGQAVARWERHGDARLLETFLWFDAAAAPLIARKLKEPNTTIAKTIRDQLRDQASPRLAGFAIRALGMPELRVAAAKAIRTASNASFRQAILTRASLCEDTEIRQGCRHVGLAQTWLEDITAFDSLSAKAANGIVSLVTSFCARNTERIALARQMVDSGQPSISRAALSLLCRTSNERSSEALQSLACRQDTTISAKAANEIRRRVGTYAQDRSQALLSTSTEDELAPRRAFEQYWHEYDRLDGVEIEMLARAMRPLVRYLLPVLRIKLADSQPFLKVRALRTADWLGVTHELVENIYGVCVHSSPVARSCAVRMLGRLPGATSNRILRRAIDDPDVRVQANALEAIDELNLEEKHQLVRPKLRSEDPRLRSTAVKSMLSDGHPEAAASLIDMLESSEGRHKRSALWIVESLNLVPVSDRVHQLRRGSRDPRIQKTASAVIHKLQGSAYGVPQGAQTMADIGINGASS